MRRIQVLGMVEIFQRAAEEEIRRIRREAVRLGVAFDVLRREFQDRFLDETVPGGRLIMDLTAECCTRSTMLTEVSEKQADYAFMVETRSYMEKTIPLLTKRAEALQQLDLYRDV